MRQPNNRTMLTETQYSTSSLLPLLFYVLLLYSNQSKFVYVIDMEGLSHDHVI